jgi:hypothetical protein
MRIAAIVLAAAGLLCAAAPDKPGPEKFAGTWEATAKGTTFLVLKITAGQKISGSMKTGEIHMDEKGELLEVGPPEEDESPIFFAQVEGDLLTFNCQSGDESVLSFELKLTGEGAGELRIVDKDHPNLKPMPVHRAKA